MTVVLSIAGSDPTGGAGMQADLQVLQAHGVHGAGVITALTVQDSKRVHQVLPAFPSVVLEQLRTLLRDIRPDAVKIGMLGTDDIVRNVILGLAQLPESVPVVIDPVLLASDGTPLLERRAWGSLRACLSRATLVTPNLPELEALTERDASSRRGAEAAATDLLTETGAGAVLVKGGHRDGAPDDLLVQRVGESGEKVSWLPGVRIPGDPVHGTGCALATAIAAHLALGRPLPEAVDRARSFVAAAIGRAQPRGEGARFLVFSAEDTASLPS